MNSFINNKNGINDKIDELQKDLNVLKEYNFDEYNKFISLFNDIKHLIRVRISKLNRTGATDEFSLKEPDISGLNEFNSLLLQKGFDSYVFYSCKNDNLNCGQLIYTMGTRNNIIPEKELSCLI
jgi:hypothetical protein